MTHDPALLTELGELTRTLAHEAALLAESYELRRDTLLLSVKNTLADVATEADLALEALIRTRLQAARPGDVLLGEEDGEAPLGTAPPTGLRWIVDPIDGTTNFRYGFGSYGVSIAVEDGAATLAGAVADPVRGEITTAVLGRGSWLHSLRAELPPRRLFTRRPGGLEEVLIDLAMGRGRDREQFASLALALQTRCTDIRRMASASTALAAIAAGRLDAYWAPRLQIWDYAAGLLLVTEAGGRVGRLDGQPVDDTGCLAAPAGVFDELAALISAELGR